MIDSVDFHSCFILVALSSDVEGNKRVLGLREGCPEATRWCGPC
jgi:hypothetical protein